MRCLVPEMPVNADRGFRDACVGKAAASLTKRASALYVGASDLSKSVSELICPIFDLTRIGSRPSIFFGCAFKGL